jgi:GTPase SAR1 family protein
MHLSLFIVSLKRTFRLNRNVYLGVDSMSSFEEIRRIIEQIKEQRTNYGEIPIVVVGNKTDRTGVREVDEQQVRTMLNELGPLHCRFAECTALDRASVIDIFLKLLSLVQLSAARQLSPILRRKVSERLKKKEFEEKNDKGFIRSRSLIRRTSMKKKRTSSSDKHSSGTPDCLIS